MSVEIVVALASAAATIATVLYKAGRLEGILVTRLEQLERRVGEHDVRLAECPLFDTLAHTRGPRA